ncbi:siderophore-interacting protein [Mesorhizobium sp. PAMC28654]|uniref:siderophore-interacting protein n=1 Tax=Mesorhizobium sp. PAMC28654 TaxID=2880934 RepID=UPI001D0A2A34|nr:siderophore-interacting protein [Mesorhizobium sp. PAMC28654]UDL87009.1 siderophore-interacting protein [Mesorhizobium sp. PAMC28654]
MPPVSPQKRRYRATTIVALPGVHVLLEPILASIATHDMAVVRSGDHFEIQSPFGVAYLEMQSGRLYLSVETDNQNALNRLKHALIGPISFIAASEKLEFDWTGDEAGLTPLEDLRVLRVRNTTQLTPRMRRIVFEGDDLFRFDRDDQLHCRLIFQPKGVTSPEWPALDDRGRMVWPEQRKLATRVYTIRAIDPRKDEITIDFALHHDAGPATRWAINAAPGDVVGIVGPAADGPKPAQFHVLAGDETGLPGIARILETFDRGVRGFAFVEIHGPDDKQPLVHPPGIEVRWLDREGAAPGTTTLLVDAVRSVAWPPDLQDSFFWGGCEHKAFRQIHRILRNEVRLPRERQVLYSHWHRSLRV